MGHWSIKILHEKYDFIIKTFTIHNTNGGITLGSQPRVAGEGQGNLGLMVLHLERVSLMFI